MSNYTFIILKLIKNYNILACKHLDIGCGSGDFVNQLLENKIDSYGADINFKKGKHTNQLIKDNRIKKIKGKTVPFHDHSFNIITSRAVIEHVKDLSSFIEENKRLLVRGGYSIHYFINKYAIIEGHNGIPFGGFIRSKIYYKIMCFLFICKKEYRMKGSMAFKKMVNGCCYRENHEIINEFKVKGFKYIENKNDLIFNFIFNGKIKFLTKIPLFLSIFGLLRTNILVFKAE